MGRHSTGVHGKVRLRHVRFYDYCYDKGGAYWGAPDNLYCAWDENGGVVYTRASDREDAKFRLIFEYGPMKFYR